MAFNIEFLQIQRDFEYELVFRLLPKNAKLLEIGAGAGYQAKRFSDDGFIVDAIDLDSSNYFANRVYKVTDYDGEHIPFEDNVFDVVYSSSVLEHVSDLDTLQAEIRRVLKGEGIALHVLPSSSWRFWTLISGYIEGFIEGFKLSIDIFKAFFRKGFNLGSFQGRWQYIRDDFLLPKRHGEQGNVLTEIWTFSSFFWKRLFLNQQYRVSLCQPTGLFYTGNMFFGDKLSISWRQFLARIFGSACVIYILTPVSK